MRCPEDDSFDRTVRVWRRPRAESQSTGQPDQLLSIVIPCYNEEEVISETVRRLAAFCDELVDLNTELIFVDDGSRDRTRDLLRRSAAQDPRMKLVGLSRNFGHQIAVTAGIDVAKGNAIVIIDADLQDPPEVAHEMIARWREGYDVVYGLRSERAGESAFKRATAKGFYRLLDRLAEVPIPLDAGDFRLISRNVADALRAMPERDRFVRGMVSWVGFKQVALPYKRSRRYAGHSKYSLSKMLRLAMDGILSFSTTPLRLAAVAGVTFVSLAIIGAICVVLLGAFTSQWPQSWLTLLIATAFSVGIQLIATGIVGEYVGRIYNEIRHRPLYLVQERFGFEDEATVSSRESMVSSG